jgi:hypothetical protein
MKLPAGTRRLIRNEIDSGKADEEIATRLDVPLENVKRIRKRIQRKDMAAHRSPGQDKSRKFETVRSDEFVEKYGAGKLSPENLAGLFCQAAERLTRADDGYEHMLSPIMPREWEVRQVLCDLFSLRGFNFMIECPIEGRPLRPVKRKAAQRTDLAVYSRSGIIDIELKDANHDEGIAKDAVKLLTAPSTTLGTAVFYLSNHQSIEKVGKK